MDEIDLAESLVDKILDGDMKDMHFAYRSVDSILDEVKTGPGGNIPDGSGPPEHGKGKGPGGGKKDGSGLDETIQSNLDENDYQAFFQKKLKEKGVKSPSELSDEDKKSFFNMIDKEWKGKKESD